MATANYTHEQRQTVLWASGELVTPEDLNAGQRIHERRLLDYMMQSLLLDGGDFDVSAAFDPWLRPVGRALSMETSSPSALSVVVHPGNVLWRSGADPGTPEPHWLMHVMDDDLTVAVDVADATNPRIDLLSAKVEQDPLDTSSVDGGLRVFKSAAGNLSSLPVDKRRRTLLTITYTPGTPAGSPVAPATPAGQVKFAEISVPATDTAIATSQISDYRTPAGYTRVQLVGTSAVKSGFAGAGLGSSQLLATAGAQVAYWHLSPHCMTVEPARDAATGRFLFGPRHMRARRVMWSGLITLAGVVELLNSNDALIQTLANAPDAQNWSFSDITTPAWVDLRSTNNPLQWMANAGNPGNGGGLFVRATSGANGNQVTGVMADFWGV